MNKKKAAFIALGVVLIGGASYVGYLFFQTYMLRQQAASACVATAFPMVVVEHNKSSIENLLQDLRSKDNKKAKSSQTKDKEYILSKDIDEKFLDLAKKLKNKDGKNSLNPSNEKLSKEFQKLVSVFDNQASQYLDECVPLFTKIASQCGDFKALSQGKSQECVGQYKTQIAKLMNKHIKKDNNN